MADIGKVLSGAVSAATQLIAPKAKQPFNNPTQAQQEINKKTAKQKLNVAGKISNVIQAKKNANTQAAAAATATAAAAASKNANSSVTTGNSAAQGYEPGNLRAIELNLSTGGRRHKRRTTRKSKKHTRKHKHKKTRRTH